MGGRSRGDKLRHPDGASKLGCATVRARGSVPLALGRETAAHGARKASQSLTLTFVVELPATAGGGAAPSDRRRLARDRSSSFRAHGRCRNPAFACTPSASRERGPEGSEAWMVAHTNVPVFSAEHARKVLESYRAPLRVEEFIARRTRRLQRRGCSAPIPGSDHRWATACSLPSRDADRALADGSEQAPAPIFSAAEGEITPSLMRAIFPDSRELRRALLAGARRRRHLRHAATNGSTWRARADRAVGSRRIPRGPAEAQSAPFVFSQERMSGSCG